MATTLDRDDIMNGLRALIAEPRSSNLVAGIRLVGGAALALRYFPRGTTQDLDSLHIHPGNDADVAAAAARVSAARGWDPGWLNFNVEQTGAVPSFGRRSVAWETIYDQDGIVIQVADKEAMLAMKLRAKLERSREPAEFRGIRRASAERRGSLVRIRFPPSPQPLSPESWGPGPREK